MRTKIIYRADDYYNWCGNFKGFAKSLTDAIDLCDTTGKRLKEFKEPCCQITAFKVPYKDYLKVDLEDEQAVFELWEKGDPYEAKDYFLEMSK